MEHEHIRLGRTNSYEKVKPLYLDIFLEMYRFFGNLAEVHGPFRRYTNSLSEILQRSWDSSDLLYVGSNSTFPG